MKEPSSTTMPVDAKPVCKTDPNLAYWYPEDFTGNAQKIATEYAIAGCGRCPHATRCLTIALEKDEKHGVWGGMTVAERDALVDGAVA